MIRMIRLKTSMSWFLSLADDPQLTICVFCSYDIDNGEIRLVYYSYTIKLFVCIIQSKLSSLLQIGISPFMLLHSLLR